MSISDRLKHFWHVVSNIRPIVWMSVYILAIPIFAVVYNLLPDGQFRIPDNAPTDFGSWLYYSTVTITTLGFGDYTPAQGLAQCVTAIEVGCGLITLGFFLNAVGSMKSEIDVESALEKQRRVHYLMEKEKLNKYLPLILHKLDAYCQNSNAYIASHKAKEADKSEVHTYMEGALRLSIFVDSMSSKIDLTLWPELIDKCFAFVSDVQMHESADSSAETLTLAQSTCATATDLKRLFTNAAAQPQEVQA